MKIQTLMKLRFLHRVSKFESYAEKSLVNYSIIILVVMKIICAGRAFAKVIDFFESTKATVAMLASQLHE